MKASKYFDLAPQQPPVDWSKALWHLPMQDILKAVDGPKGIFADAMPVDTGGRMIQRAPNDPAWYKGGLFHDDKTINVPGLWFMSWYDVSIGPNLALYNHVRKTAKPDIGRPAVGHHRARRALLLHPRDRGHGRRRAQHGRRALRLRRRRLRVLRPLPEGREERAARQAAEGDLLHDGLEQVADLGHAGRRPARSRVTFYLSSGGRANSLHGDGALTPAPPEADRPDAFTYDPMNPVTSYGGNVCCTGTAITAGSFDQRKMEARADILVYTSEPFTDGVEAQRAHRADALRLVRREGHRLHRQGARRLP